MPDLLVRRRTRHRDGDARRVRRQLRAALGERDCALLLGDLRARGAGAEARLAQVLRFRQARGDRGAQGFDPAVLAHEAVTLLLPPGHTATVQERKLRERA